jgi:RNA polymerase sigma-70 factor (sigma-E family)
MVHVAVGDAVRVPSPAAAAFDALYLAEHTRLVRLATLVIGSSASAEDLVQDAFAKLHVRWARIDTPEAWLRTVVMNAARNEVRHAAVRRRVLGQFGHRVDVAALDPPVHELIASLRRLNARQRAVVVLRFYEDLPEAEIARILKMRVGTVKSTLHRALAHLRQEVER